MAENNNFSNVGVANTGQMTGSITGNSQHIQVNENAKDLFAAFEHFKKEIAASSSLTTEQREDAFGAVSELEDQANKPGESRIMSKVRNAVAALKTLSSGTAAIHGLYEQVHPLLLSHFHLPS